MKLIAFYLPQFYVFEENNRWWGDGFTEWTNVKKARPLYRDHDQPKVPLHQNYYDLSTAEEMYRQVKMARHCGLYGFCFYHYWFGEDQLLLEKPVELYLGHEDLDLPFCLSWANHDWTRTWIGRGGEMLMQQTYGDEQEWKKHFYYLLQFFKDKRYIKIDNRPVLVIFRPEWIPDFVKVLSFWNHLAIKEGLGELCIISQSGNSDPLDDNIDYTIMYEPNYTQQKMWNVSKREKLARFFRSPGFMTDRAWNMVKVKLAPIFHRDNTIWNTTVYSYDWTWREILRRKPLCDKMIPGAFVGMDSTPRRQFRATVYRGNTPQKFYRYLFMLLKKTRAEFKTDFIFITAWNEWGEGSYLEPDEKNGYGYLNAVKKALREAKEWEAE